MNHISDGRQTYKLTVSPAIPDFPEFREPLVTDVTYFNSMASEVYLEVSELSFTNIYVWRQSTNCLITVLNGNICVFVQSAERPAFFLPPLGESHLQDTVETLFNYQRGAGNHPILSRVPEETSRMLADAFPEVIVEEDPDNADYIYLSSDLADLPGRKYHKKRNHIARFVENHNFEYHRLTPELVPGVRDFQECWCKVRGCFSPGMDGLAAEHTAIMETLDNYEALGVTGGVVTVENKVVAFTIGEPLNDDMFVIHFEKANPEYQGAYQTVNQRFVDDVCRPYKFVNREQDLGEPGLRQAKNSYHPHHLLMKYTVSLPE